MKSKNIIKIQIVFLVALTIAISMAGCKQAAENTYDNPPTESQMQILFKLDSRLTQGLYMGERWVSPPTYGPIVSSENTYAVEAMAAVLDTNGQQIGANIEWEPQDPEMVVVSPGEGYQVTITILRAGESNLLVTAQGLSKTLNIQATQKNDVIQVQISQVDEAE